MTIKSLSKIWIAVFVLLLIAACDQPEKNRLLSPDGKLEAVFELSSEGRPQYQLIFAGQQVLLPSQLGLSLSGENLYSDLRLVREEKPRLHRDTYSMHHGKQKNIDYVANEYLFRLENSNKTALDIRIRISNEGFAYRYELPARLGEKSDDVKVIDQEYDSWAFPSSAKAWLQEMSVAQTGWSNVNPAYEENYQLDIPVGTPSPSPAGWVFPALFKSNDYWVLISETSMNGNWHASRLHANSENGVYKIAGPTKEEVITDGALMANSTLPFHSPWRIMAVGTLADIAESTLGTDLAEPAKFPVEKFKPGTASWSWALLKDDSVNYNTTKEFIDYAAQMNWDYTLIDVNWDQNIGEQKIRELVEYAKEKGIGLLLWYNSSGKWNLTEYTPKSQLVERTARRAEFAKLQAWGIRGVKIDFFPGDGQSVMQYYNELAHDAAEFGLLVNYHGSSLPRGLQRTYPNLMTMEAIKGFEFITFTQENADKGPEHMALLPFTRNAFDPMDFTPTVFDEIPNIKRPTTNGFEAALPVLFLSGIQHIAETPENMAKQPTWLQDYMRDIPVIWDETRLVSADPGKHVVLARRSGKRWYIAGINGENKTKTLALDLAFLDKAKGILFSDKAARVLEKSSISTETTADIMLLPYGGFVMLYTGE